MSALYGPWCQDVEHESSVEQAAAVAVVPLISIGMVTPYAWMLICAPCLDGWLASRPDPRITFYRLEESR